MRAGTIRRIVAAAVALAMLAAVRPTAADDSAGQVWLISTRGAPRCSSVDPDHAPICYWRFRDRKWDPAKPDDFFEIDGQPVPMTLFIHGNRTDLNGAIGDAWRVLRRMRRDAAGRPFRFVIWTWPSDRIRGTNRRDVRLKAAYSDVQSRYLADCLARLDRDHPNVPVGLIGYSFGARVITGALELLAGGRVAGRTLPQSDAANQDAAEPADEKRGPRRRAVLVAAALDADWLLPGRRHGRALSQVERMLVIKNPRDPVLRFYPRMYHRGGPQAMGYAGPAGCPPAEKIELLSVGCSVGRNHDWAHYAASPGLLRRLAWYTFLDPPDPADDAAAPQGPAILNAAN